MLNSTAALNAIGLFTYMDKFGLATIGQTASGSKGILGPVKLYVQLNSCQVGLEGSLSTLYTTGRREPWERGCLYTQMYRYACCS